jgi:hypothetical protein
VLCGHHVRAEPSRELPPHVFHEIPRADAEALRDWFGRGELCEDDEAPEWWRGMVPRAGRVHCRNRAATLLTRHAAPPIGTLFLPCFARAAPRPIRRATYKLSRGFRLSWGWPGFRWAANVFFAGRGALCNGNKPLAFNGKPGASFKISIRGVESGHALVLLLEIATEPNLIDNILDDQETAT